MLSTKLQTVLAVAEYKNFTRAAEELFFNQSTVSAHISLLEQALGKELFVRSNRRHVRLTKEGEQVYPIARRVLNDCAALRGIKHHGVLRPVIDLDLRYAGHIAQIVFQYVRLMQRHPGALHVHPQTPGGFMENCAFHGYSAVASSSEVSSTTAAASSSARCSLMALASA